MRPLKIWNGRRVAFQIEKNDSTDQRHRSPAEATTVRGFFVALQTMFERSLEENVAVTGVLSSLCLAATATEVSPVRRLLLVLLFDGTKGAPFRRCALKFPEH